MTKVSLAAAVVMVCLMGCVRNRSSVAFARLEVRATPIEVLRLSSDHLEASGYRVRLSKGTLYGERTEWTLWSPGMHVVGVLLTPVFVLTLPIGAIIGGGPNYMIAGFAVGQSADIDRSISLDFGSCQDGFSTFQMASRSGDNSSQSELESLAQAILSHFPSGTFELTAPPTDNTR